LRNLDRSDAQISIDFGSELTDMEVKLLGETTFSGLTIEENLFSVRYKEKIGRDPYLDLNLKFPQIEGNSDYSKANKTIKDIMFMTFDGEKYDESIKMFKKMIEGEKLGYFSGDTTYEIIYASDSEVSFIIDVVKASTNRVNNSMCCATIDLASGEVIPFTDYFTVESVAEAIRSARFELLEGPHSPGAYKGNEPEIVKGFAEEFELNLEYYESRHKEFGRDKYIDGSALNFCMDDECIYLAYYYSDSLDGFIMLKFNKSDLVRS
jgi:hypothetical protein